jgi:hypothetical protein
MTRETSELLEALKDLRFALAWHCREGAGPRGMDQQYLREASELINRFEEEA